VLVWCRHIRWCTAPQWCNDNCAICRCSDECGGDCGECSLTAHYLCEQWRRDQAALWTRVRNHNAACMHACMHASMHACALHTMCACQHQANMRAHSPLTRRFRAPAWLPALLGARCVAGGVEKSARASPGSIDRSTSATACRSGGGLSAPKGSAQAAEPRLWCAVPVREEEYGQGVLAPQRHAPHAMEGTVPSTIPRQSRPRHSVG
jgi:hypothetical protein